MGAIYNQLYAVIGSNLVAVTAPSVRNTATNLKSDQLISADYDVEFYLNTPINILQQNACIEAFVKWLMSGMVSGLQQEIAQTGPASSSSIYNIATYLSNTTAKVTPAAATCINLALNNSIALPSSGVLSPYIGASTISFLPIQTTTPNGMGRIAVGGSFLTGSAVASSYSSVQPVAVIDVTFVGGTAPPTWTVYGTNDSGITSSANPTVAPSLSGSTGTNALGIGNYTVGYSYYNQNGETALSPTAVSQSGILTPTVAPSATQGAGAYNSGTMAAGTWLAAITYINSSGETPATPTASVVLGIPSPATSVTGTISNATGPTPGTYVVGYSFSDSQGETIISPTSTFTLGVPTPTTAPTLSLTNSANTLTAGATYQVGYTWTTATGETSASPAASIVCGIGTPSTPYTVTATTGGTIAPGTYQVAYTWTNAAGETVASASNATVVPTGTSTNTITVQSVTFPAGATSQKVYISQAGGSVLYYYGAQTSAGAFLITSIPATTAANPPTSNTTNEAITVAAITFPTNASAQKFYVSAANGSTLYYTITQTTAASYTITAPPTTTNPTPPTSNTATQTLQISPITFPPNTTSQRFYMSQPGGTTLYYSGALTASAYYTYTSTPPTTAANPSTTNTTNPGTLTFSALTLPTNATGVNYYVSTAVGGSTLAKAGTGTGAAFTLTAAPSGVAPPTSNTTATPILINSAPIPTGMTGINYYWSISAGSTTLKRGVQVTTAGSQLISTNATGVAAPTTNGTGGTTWAINGSANNPFVSNPATTSTAIVAQQRQSVTLSSAAWLLQGSVVTIDTGINAETVIVESISGNMITAVFRYAHASGVSAAWSTTLAVTPSFPGTARMTACTNIVPSYSGHTSGAIHIEGPQDRVDI